MKLFDAFKKKKTYETPTDKKSNTLTEEAFNTSEKDLVNLMVSESRIGKLDKKQLEQLKSLIVKLTSELSYEDTFINMGFEITSLEREYSIYELDKKMSFFIDRLFERKGTFLYWCENATKIDVFLDNYEFLIEWLKSINIFSAILQFSSATSFTNVE